MYLHEFMYLMNTISWINDLFRVIHPSMEDVFKKYLGIKIRSLRENAHITQEDLANFCDVSWRSISNLERGKVVPDLFVLCKISKRFNISLDEMLNVDVSKIKSFSRISAENLLIEKIKTVDDKMLDFIIEQFDITFKHFGN